MARKGFDLLDKKRQVLINELLVAQSQAGLVREDLCEALDKAQTALFAAQMEMGANKIKQIGITPLLRNTQRIQPYKIDEDEAGSGGIGFRGIMGVELPQVNSFDTFCPISYELHNTTVSLDEAALAWKEARKFIISWAVIENTIYRLRLHIKKTQKRANALGNITIPRYMAQIKYIEEQLEERERDELARLKRVKASRT